MQQDNVVTLLQTAFTMARARLAGSDDLKMPLPTSEYETNCWHSLTKESDRIAEMVASVGARLP